MGMGERQDRLSPPHPRTAMAGRNKSGHDEALGTEVVASATASALTGFPDVIAQELSRPLLNVTHWDVRVA
jgi:hypothetical protein